VRERPSDKLKKIMNDLNKWKEFFNEVAEHCSYWELGFGAIDAEYESEIVRQAFVGGADVDEACDQWREAIAEIAIGG
tara:strand:- start:240 stop:473 length:234 start_codon:yes stop_codon:yes gene_type:complete